MHVEVEQGPALAARFIDDELVEGVLIGNDQVLLHVHQITHRCATHLPELRGQLHATEEGVDLLLYKQSGV